MLDVGVVDSFVDQISAIEKYSKDWGTGRAFLHCNCSQIIANTDDLAIWSPMNITVTFAHFTMILGIAASVWLIDFCHKAI